MSYSFPQYNNFTPSDNYETPYPNIPNHSIGSLPPLCGQPDMMSPSPESSGLGLSRSPSMDLFQQRPDNAPQQGHETMGANGLLGAYMCLEEQIKFLQHDILQLRMDKQMLARERDLHQRVFQLAAYNKLAESLSLTLDPASLSTLSPQSLPVMLKAKEIAVPSYNCADFPSEFIWTKEDWKKRQEKPSTQLEKLHPLRYIVDKNNKPIPLERVTAIRTTSRRVFVDIWNIKEAPKSWGAASGSASKLYYREMVTFFPELGYCDGNWKCDAIATASYTSWRKNHISCLVREGTYKPTAEDILDFDNLETLDSDDTDCATGDVKPKKRTRDSDPLSIASISSKKQKPSEISVPEHESPMPTPPLPDSDESQPTDLGHSDNVNETHASRPPARFCARPLKFANPLTTLEPTTSADQLPLIPPSPSEDILTPSTAPAEEPISTQPTGEHTPSIALTPEHSLDHPDIVPDTNPPTAVVADLVPTSTTTVPLLVLDASATSKPHPSVPAKKSRKMQVGKAQNGRNLCAREWLTHNKTGSAAEFKTYYDGLSEAQKKSYDELAAKKVAAGEWLR
ncbi:hypothetical protein DFJ58DRAFT_733462 [Suillus subalutaceus]|uniref:uncharacterized protein n=1 Tax=Suillus subalutaceus TaxID=48586 RepID=UPI001B87F2A1|nr:uncharacterized protein DFJ58DRAFT_733462 [Suillus subalutaceus]KAG1839240.1 hypothetical protein DFJ58DRAFT_733462 [Suillus subalutaceus]